MHTHPRQCPQPAQPSHTQSPDPWDSQDSQDPQQRITLGSKMHPGPPLVSPLQRSIHTSSSNLLDEPLLFQQHSGWTKGIPLISGPPESIPNFRRQKTPPGKQKPDRDPLQTSNHLIPPRLTRSKNKTSVRNGVPHHGSPAVAPTCFPHEGPHQPHCSAQRGKVLEAHRDPSWGVREHQNPNQ